MSGRSREVATLAGFVGALIIGALMLAVQGYDPVAGYRSLLDGSLGGSDAIGDTLKAAIPVLLCGLSAALAFASGPVNLGQPGQFVLGAMAAATVGIHIDLPPLLAVPIVAGAGALTGALWAGVAALGRRRFGMDEFITTLMLNYIAASLTDWMITWKLVIDNTGGSLKTRAIDGGARLGTWAQVPAGAWITLVVVACLGVVMRRSVWGYEWRMSGQAPLFARFGGVDAGSSFTATMLLSGALAGLGGALLLMGSGSGRFLKGYGANFGWDGVMVAVIAANALLGVAVFALFFAVLDTGSITMQIVTDVPSEYVLVLKAAIVLVVVATRTWASGAFTRWLTARRVRRRPVAGSADGPSDA